MAIPRIKAEVLDEKKAPQKQPRKIAVKNASFYLYKKDKDDESLSLLGSYQTEDEIRKAYEKALDEDIFQENLVGFKGRFLEFMVKPEKRRVTVR